MYYRLNKKRKFLIRNIIADIGNVTIPDKVKILNLLALRVGGDNIYQEGLGSRIMFKLMNTDLLVEIDELVQEMKKATAIDFSPSKIPSCEQD